ncbi:MAG TPA: DUF262 domain-containing protein [Nostocaceae cyanobacterium]|nr:DUF262 domain-containing protein [Nostocaceae cyanobacterium]
MGTWDETNDLASEDTEYLDNKDQETEVEESLEEEDDILPSRFSISVSRTDFDVDGIVKRLRQDDIRIPDFQRAYVWKPKQASRLVESLLLGLPVPGIFLAKELDTNRLLVLDGQQRLISLKSFYDGKFPNSRSSFTLKGVHDNFQGKTYKGLTDVERRQLDNSVISATIIQADPDNEESIYYIFERLNTGGTLLKPQEIRACIYHGELNDLLRSLNNNSAWRNIYGIKDKNKKDQELIIRFLALYFESNYKPSMKDFINKFMNRNRDLKYYSRDQIIKAFAPTVELIEKCIGSKVFRPEKIFLPTFFESIMVGVARRLEKGEVQNTENFKERYYSLTQNEEFKSISMRNRNLTGEQNVKERIRMATEAFADLI